MERNRLEIKVGLFVLIGLVLLAILLLQFSKGTSLFRGTYELRLHAANVGGIKPRAGVLLAGVQIGSVSDIRLAADGKSVTMLLKIYKDCKIYHDAQFVIEQAGFLGDQFIAINPAENSLPLLADGADVDCAEPFDLQKVARSASGLIERVDGTAQKLDASISELQRVVLNDQTLTNFSIAVGNLRIVTEQARTTVDDLNALIATNGVQATVAVSNVAAFSQQLKGLGDSADTLLATNGVEISAAVKNLEASSETLKKLMDDLQAGKGLAGTVLQNPDLATNMQIIANNLAITTSNLNRRGLWGILWSHKPPTNNPPAKP